MASMGSHDAGFGRPAADLLAQALAAHRAGDLRQAEQLYEARLRLDGNDSGALALLGTLKGQAGRLDDALALLTRSLALNPYQLLALNSSGNVLRLLKRHDEALACFDKAIALKPDFLEAHGNRGITLQDLKRHREAVACYDRIIALNPSNAESHCNRGHALEELGRHDEALASYNKAIALNPDYADAYQRRLGLLRDLERYEEALRDYEKLIQIDPPRPYIASEYLSLKLDVCRWDHFVESCELLRRKVAEGARISTPFAFLKIPATADLQRRCAEIYIADKYLASPRPLWRGERYAHDRIRVGYFSSDFREHATAYLMAELLEKHDRSRFEISGFSFGHPNDDAMRQRLAKSFHRLIDVDALTDEAAAQLVKGVEIDIAVDLKGFTRDGRPGIFALRPAPIQVNFLGFPGTMGTSAMDYIIADHTLIPDLHIPSYSEKIVFLPNSYQPNDTQRKIAPNATSRAQAGLPEDGFVFCCFNNSFKITPDVFDVWMRLLHSVDGSVLWLLASNTLACATLRREAHTRGVDPARLVFAPKLSLPEHLARHRLADLFLDTFHCNAHTTASDALWAGLPVLTCPRETFASRVAASLLTAIGLPDLIAESPHAYEALALHLSRSPAALMAMRERLAHNRLTHPLFDIDLFTRHLEMAYSAMWQRHHRGHAPDHIDVAAIA
jgi:predicted O-linked N-acetylglucosamine transferase (SPINDLY family)